MTRDRDIERVLEAWLQPGPAGMPDHLLETVLDHVDHQPQRRLARLHWGIPSMRSTTQFAIAAALVVAVGVGIVLIGRPSTLGIGAPTLGPTLGPVGSTSPAPSAAPTAPSTAAAALPAELQHRWIGAPRVMDSLSSTTDLPLLWIQGSGVAINRNLGRREGQSTATSSGPGLLTLTLDAPLAGCTRGDQGNYNWSIANDGVTLTLLATRDSCLARTQLLSWTWTRSDCRDPNDTCLGAVPAGTYVSTFLDLRSAARDVKGWGAYGQLRYTVPTGWANRDDWPNNFALQLATDYAGPGGDPTGDSAWPLVSVLARPVAVVQDDQCSNTPALGVGSSPAGLAAWVVANPGVHATPATPISINGRDGIMVDVSLAKGWKKTCPGMPGGAPIASFVAEGGKPDGWALGVASGERMRLIFLDIGGATALISIDDSSSPSRFDELVAQAMPIVRTFAFLN
jgi:hypothetical protein